MTDRTPMVRQYQEIKSRHKDAILFFRLGDFYEMFNEDAILASKELEIVLTGRGQNENRMPMCGVPFHAADAYISRLIDKGYKVAICEQVEDPKSKSSKGPVKREVIKVVTPGTVIEASMLPEKKSNYLMAVTKGKGGYGLAYIDASTGDFRATQVVGEKAKEKLLEEIDRINPSECLVSDIISEDDSDITDFLKLKRVSLSSYKDIYDFEIAEDKLKSHFGVKSIESFGLDTMPLSLGAAQAIIDYLKDNQKTSLPHVNNIKPYHLGEFMFLDSTTRRNLEITETVRDRSFRGSLLWVLDKTKTSMGNRLLRKWVLEPLVDIDQINLRLDAVEELYRNTDLRIELGDLLGRISDIERLTGRIASCIANARDLASLKESLRILPQVKEKIKSSKSFILQKVNELYNFKEVIDLIEGAIMPDPPFGLRDGGLIKKGFRSELDELKAMVKSGKEWIARLEDEERRRTGIKSLKVGFTKVFGYYIEVTKSNFQLVPENYIRKQTLVAAERFITPELKEKESLILNADERLKELEYSIFCDVRKIVASYTRELQKLASVIAALDVFRSLAEVSALEGYVRPIVEESSNVLIEGSKHPVVEKIIGEHYFVANDAKMDEREERFLLITGPNMAGKSTYMRQIALIILLAQIGSFVPATKAKIGIVDRIFTRIGAMDDIFRGQSTFMLEMTETANILNSATDKSLIILDEIGRGTSTFDGMSIAAAVAEYIHLNIKSRTLFATHYHEITELAIKHKGMKNLNVQVKEEGDHITFLYRVVPGPADRSYGIQVAKLAGLPKEVVERAKEVYNTLEMVENNLGKKERPTTQKKIKDKKAKTVRLQKTLEENQIGLF